MIASTFDLWVAVGVVITMPLIIAVNVNRQAGVMGYVWCEAPVLARVGLVFLALTWLSAIQSLLTYYGVLPAQVDDVISVVLGIPMFALSMIILVWGAVLLVRFLNGGRTPDSAT
jgi:hypothetical protein